MLESALLGILRRAPRGDPCSGRGVEMTIRVLVCDGHRMFREGLKSLLDGCGDIEVVEGAADGDAALLAIAGGAIDVAVVDMQLPPSSGIRTIERIRAIPSAPACVALSSRGSRMELERALSSGATAFLHKTCAAQELIEAIRVVSSGRCYVPPGMAQDLIAALGRCEGTNATGMVGLTVREHEVLELIAEGHSSRQIARQLGVSTRTVDSHRARLMGKLGVCKTASLVRFAVREGLIAA